MKSIRVDADSAAVEEFEHPNGETGILMALNTTTSELIEYFDLDISVTEDNSIVMPLKHKADGATNFESYSREGDDLVVSFQDDQYDEVRTRLTQMIG